MITIVLSADGIPKIWNAEDWLVLREEYRIVGELIGVLPNFPSQDNYLGLPATLLPEEATLLVERQVARICRFPSLSRCPGEGVLSAYKNHLKKTYEEQSHQLIEDRKRTLSDCVDRIIEGRRRKQLGLSTKKKHIKKKKKTSDARGHEDETDIKTEDVADMPIDDEERAAVMDEELAKFPAMSKENTLVQTFTAYPWLREEDACPAIWTFPSTPEEKLLYGVFKDLWERGYYISPGNKFGGDYIVYPGDPVKFHSQFIIVCVDHSAPVSAQQFVSYGRLGSSVRKTVVLASLRSSGDIIYQSIKWAGTS